MKLEAETEVEKQAFDERSPGVIVPSLEGLWGRVRVDVAGAPLGTIQVENANVTWGPVRDRADALLAALDGDDLRALLLGTLNPIVASIQGRIALHGNLELVVRVILGLHASRASAEAPEGE